MPNAAGPATAMPRSLSAALRMLTNVLHEEAQGLGVRVQMLPVDKPVSTAANERNACAEWPSAMAVGRHAVSLLTRNERQHAPWCLSMRAAH